MNNSNNYLDNRFDSTPNQLGNIDERSNSFFEDILDDDLMADFPKMPKQLMTSDKNETYSIESSRGTELKEISFYGLNNIENVEDLINKEKVKKANEI